MNVLVISANTFSCSPSGPAYVAGAARDAGHTVEVFDCLFAQDPLRELEEHVARFTPDVIGISVRAVAGKIVDAGAEFNTRPFDARILVKEIVGCLKRTTQAHIVLGGCGFNYYGPEWLEYLDLDYGIRGEAEFSFPLYLKRLEEGQDVHTVPGCIFYKNGRISKVSREHIRNLDGTALPAYDLFDLDKYADRNISAGIFTKRGCAFQCTYCPYSSLEGTRYRLKSPGRVVDEIEHIQQAGAQGKIEFCDNSFNVPRKHAQAICASIIRRNLDIGWSTGSIKPIGITDDLCQLFRDSGCANIGLSIESASDRMLKSTRRGYTVKQVKNALTCLGRSGIPFGVSLMLGAPGETPETIAETFEVIDSFPAPKWTWVTVGLNLWTRHQQVLDDAHKDGQLKDDRELFNEVNYISAELPKEYMVDLIDSLKERENCYFQVNKPYAAYEWAAASMPRSNLLG
ncbi:MAG: radical SAM protein [Anaerolineae bacterium]|nr:radical SAM protein [Anaerolineae bacterium]